MEVDDEFISAMLSDDEDDDEKLKNRKKLKNLSKVNEEDESLSED